MRDDAIMATGRSDYPNQVNNVLGFPYIFRGALDVRATTINDEMKLAAARGARRARPRGRARRGGRRLSGQPAALRPALHHPGAVRSAADLRDSRRPSPRRRWRPASRAGRSPTWTPTRSSSRRGATRSPARCSRSRRACAAQPQARRLRRGRGGAGDPRRGELRQPAARHGDPGRPRGPSCRSNAEARRHRPRRAGIEIINARLSTPRDAYADYLYARLQRKGYLFRDCQRLVNTDRNHFAACMVALGDADALVTGITRNYSTVLEDIRRCIDPKPGHRVIGVSIALCRGRTVFVADTAVHDMPNSEELADIAEEAAGVARRLGFEPRVAMLAYSTFGHPPGERAEKVQRGGRHPRQAPRRFRV